MAGIQNSINNLLNIAAVAQRLSPEYAAKEAEQTAIKQFNVKKQMATAEAKAGDEAADQMLQKDLKVTKQGTARIGASLTSLEGNVRVLNRAIAASEKAQAFDPTNDRQTKLEGLYAQKSEMEDRVIEKRAEKDLKKKQKEFRSSFINWREIDPTRGGK